MKAIKDMAEFPRNIYDDIFEEATKYKTEKEKETAMTYEQFLESYIEVLDKMTSNLEGYYKVRALFILYERYKEGKKYTEISKECDITPTRVSGIAMRAIRLGSRVIFTNTDTMRVKTKEPVKEYSSINRLDLSIRPYNCLIRKGIRTVGDLTNYTESDLLKIRNLGTKSVKEIKKSLKERGFSLRKDEDDE